jgi:hypothetical protein
MTTSGEVNSAMTRIATEIKLLKTYISGSGTGDVSGLTTTATDLVAAINEVLDIAESAAGGGLTEGEVETIAQGIVDTSITGLIGGADAAGDTLKELYDLIVATDGTLDGLLTTVAGKAEDDEVVHLTGNETIAGTKTFSSAPAVPDASFTIAKTNGLQTALDAKAPLASPALTGTPTAPTNGTAATSNTQIATTAFVQAAVDAKLGDYTTDFVATFEAGLA